MLRAVLDVGTLAAGTICQAGPAGALLGRWRAGEFTLVTCEPLVAAYREVLSRPRILNWYCGLSNQRIAACASTLRGFSQVVSLPASAAQAGDEDWLGGILVRCAVEGAADYIVCGEREPLLRAKECGGIPIVSPTAFMEILESDRVRRVPRAQALTEGAASE
ncbi:MAG: hypothetical protein HY660_17410 [Armatimonadetes bacterium]|nr:hypothetical protein [Armatimonadota bacterium]